MVEMNNDSKIEKAAIKLRVSSGCYNEIALALERTGKKVAHDAPITLEKDIALVDPIDWRKVTVRENVAKISAQVYAESDANQQQTVAGYLKFTNEVYNFILTGALPGENEHKNEHKKEPENKSDNKIWK